MVVLEVDIKTSIASRKEDDSGGIDEDGDDDDTTSPNSFQMEGSKTHNSSCNAMVI